MTAILDPRRAATIARKELRHLARDPLSGKVLLLFPLIFVVFFGYAIDFEVRDVDVVVSDGDRSRQSRELIDALSRSGYFKVRHARDILRAGTALGDGRAKAVMIVPSQFQHDLKTGRSVSAQFLLDGSDDQTAAIITSYLSGIEDAARRRLAVATPPAARLRTRFLFNEELDSRWFIVPGLLAFVLGVFSTMLPALTLAREWENGSMELLLSTPMRPLDLVFGKLAPYFALGLLDAALVYVVARGVFGVPFLGSHLALAAGTVLFLLATLSQGLAISAVMRSQRLAYQLAMQTGTWPTQLLSGFVFPIQNMPWFFQGLVMFLPARWYMELVRSSFLRAADASSLAGPLTALAALALVFIALAWAAFKSDLEP